MTATPEVVRVLEKARAHVARGWCQGEYVIGDAVCIAGAMNLAVGLPVDSDRTPTGVELEAFRFLYLTGVSRNTAEWNDVPGRTEAEVLAAFDRAIVLARSAHP